MMSYRAFAFQDLIPLPVVTALRAYNESALLCLGLFLGWTLGDGYLKIAKFISQSIEFRFSSKFI